MDFGLNTLFSAILPYLTSLASRNPFSVAMYLFWHGLWVIFLGYFTHAIYEIWLDGRQGQYASKWKFVLLAIDIPKNNEQTPKAVENLFQTIAGAHSNFNMIDSNWVGKILDSFSFEIVSIEGYTQFLIRTQSKYRDLIEASIYAQYPDAEITEVEDYTKDFAKMTFPNDQYDLWGTEFVLVKDYPYPIKTYNEFEHTLTQGFMDPMASLLEIFSRFIAGEQGWMQLIVTPQKPGWGEKAKKIVKELSGQSYSAPKKFSDDLLAMPASAIEGFTSGVLSIFNGGAAAAPAKKEADQFRVMNLSPGQRTALEKVENKISKSNFNFKWRYIYIGKKEVFNKTRGVSGVTGSMKQFNTLNCNALKPGGGISKTAVDYFRVPQRVAAKQNRILRLFIGRSNYYGDSPGNQIMNEEELATVWHFPVMTVKAMQVEKIESKKSAPPTRLPYQAPKEPSDMPTEAPSPISSPPANIPFIENALPDIAQENPAEKKKSAPPPNLPVV
ncbi:MAG: hypothetical protein WCV92_03985 [Candidatus Buchananbacteria bacterium]